MPTKGIGWDGMGWMDGAESRGYNKIIMQIKEGVKKSLVNDSKQEIERKHET
jgi:hypothetical protein